MIKNQSRTSNADFFNRSPVMPSLVEVFIFRQPHLIEIVRQRIGELNLKLLQRRLFVGLGIKTVKVLKGRYDVFISDMFGQSHKIEVVPSGITFENQHCLDSQNFGKCRNGQLMSVKFDVSRFKRFITYQLPNSCLDAIKAAKNLDRTCNTGCLPTRNGFQLRQHSIESVPEVSQDMIGIHG